MVNPGLSGFSGKKNPLRRRKYKLIAVQPISLLIFLKQKWQEMQIKSLKKKLFVDSFSLKCEGEKCDFIAKYKEIVNWSHYNRTFLQK